MKQLVKLWKRPSYDGQSYTYYLLYTDEKGLRRQKSLGHTDTRKAERQRAQYERDLKIGSEPASMDTSLIAFLDDILSRCRGQVRESTLQEYQSTMNNLISMVGNLSLNEVEQLHGEKFIQHCLSDGNRTATVRKKIAGLKRLFQMAVERGLIEKNPFLFIRKPKISKRPIRIILDEECQKIIQVTQETELGWPFRWDILIITALSTAMRRGELLNMTWNDIDFESRKINITSKHNTPYTWEWTVKDSQLRSVPITNGLLKALAKHQSEQPDGYPYVFIPPKRYDHIQILRKKESWSARHGRCPINNFRRQFLLILKRAGVRKVEFHDFRRTCLSNWFSLGLREYDVMQMAGHSSFETTRNFYLAVKGDLLGQAREASEQVLSRISVANLLQ
jgi:integrase